APPARTDHEHRGRFVWLYQGRGSRSGVFHRQGFIRLAKLAPDLLVVCAVKDTEPDHHPGDQHGHEAALSKLLYRRHGKNSGSHGQAEAGESNAYDPAAVGAPYPPPVDAKPKKRKREGKKDIDAVELRCVTSRLDRYRYWCGTQES